MSLSPTSGPDGAVPLSPREKRTLAAIEDGLRAADPGLALRMRAVPMRRGGSRTPGGLSAAGAVGLLLLVVGAALPPTWRAVLGLVLVLVVLPWILLCVERRRVHVDEGEDGCWDRW